MFQQKNSELKREKTNQWNLDRFLTSQQVADTLNVKMRTVKYWRQNGGGPKYIRVAKNKVRYRLQDVLQWVDSRCHSSMSEEKIA